MPLRYGITVFTGTVYLQQVGGEPSQPVSDLLESSFGSVENFQKEFTEKAIGQFGSGWAWLVKKTSETLAIETTGNADNPLQKGHTPLLTCDVWEHAYYIDYRNARPEYLKAFWKIINWDFIHKNLQS